MLFAFELDEEGSGQDGETGEELARKRKYMKMYYILSCSNRKQSHYKLVNVMVSCEWLQSISS